MKFLLLLTLFATLLFVPAWWVQHPYQQALAATAGRIVAPPGSEIEIVDIELFYPFDISIYLALCLASVWLPLGRRLRATAIGVSIMVLIELLSVVLAMAAILSVMTNPRATAGRAEEIYRFSVGIIRVTGLIAAAAVWFFQLGRERLSLAARTWLGA
jgi:hypothetical protein